MHFIPPLLQDNAFCKSLMLYSAQAKLTELFASNASEANMQSQALSENWRRALDDKKCE